MNNSPSIQEMISKMAECGHNRLLTKTIAPVLMCYDRLETELESRISDPVERRAIAAQLVIAVYANNS